MDEQRIALAVGFDRENVSVSLFCSCSGLETPWDDADTVGPPLIQYLERKRDDGENFREWILTLRALNKSWYLEATGHIHKVRVCGDQQLEQLTKSLQGSLTHVKFLELEDISTEALAFDEEAGSLSMNAESSICDVMNSAVNIKMLWLANIIETNNEFGALLPMSSVKILVLTESQSLAVVQKFPNLETLQLYGCRLCRSDFKCSPRLRTLSIDSPFIKDQEHLPMFLKFQPFDQPFLDGLANLTELTELKFVCHIRSRADHQALWKLLGRLTNLKSLSLPASVRQDEVKREFMKALPPSLEELELWEFVHVRHFEFNAIVMDTTFMERKAGNWNNTFSCGALE
ncbi:hypothetical protein BSKO_12588 [Bryopsis sp. KO-2023]|nr:hypothetical protein BSKO_12588 [Bryopsis sp. KO-2023]